MIDSAASFIICIDIPKVVSRPQRKLKKRNLADSFQIFDPTKRGRVIIIWFFPVSSCHEVLRELVFKRGGKKEFKSWKISLSFWHDSREAGPNDYDCCIDLYFSSLSDSFIGLLFHITHRKQTCGLIDNAHLSDQQTKKKGRERKTNKRGGVSSFFVLFVFIPRLVTDTTTCWSWKADAF